MIAREMRIRRIGSFFAWLVGSLLAYLVFVHGPSWLQIGAISAGLGYVLDDWWRIWWRSRCDRRTEFSAADMKIYLDGINRRNVN